MAHAPFSACLDFSVESLPRKNRSVRKYFLISDDRGSRKDSIGRRDADYILYTSVSPGLQKNGDKKNY
jgi:hypothetical protein